MGKAKRKKRLHRLWWDHDGLAKKHNGYHFHCLLCRNYNYVLYSYFFLVVLTCKDDATNGNGLCRSARLWSVWDRKPDSSNFTRLQQHGNNRTIAISNPSEYGFTLWYRRHYVSVASRALILESDEVPGTPAMSLCGTGCGRDRHVPCMMCLSGTGEKSDFPTTASTTCECKIEPSLLGKKTQRLC